MTHSKLIVGVYRSFPHRSGVVETLHVVGLVEARRGREFQVQMTWDYKKNPFTSQAIKLHESIMSSICVLLT